jgi:hypothetical protein
MEQSPKRRKRMRGFGIALLGFVLGSLFTAALMHANQVRADNSRVFEFRVYHALPGKLPALEARFRDSTSKLLAKHNLNVVGFWAVPEDSSPAWNNTFVFMLAHSSLDEAKQNWDAFGADPAFQELIKSEQAAPTVTKVERVYLHPEDFSPMK